jgi:hypothetical protein
MNRKIRRTAVAIHDGVEPLRIHVEGHDAIRTSSAEEIPASFRHEKAIRPTLAGQIHPSQDTKLGQGQNRNPVGTGIHGENTGRIRRNQKNSRPSIHGTLLTKSQLRPSFFHPGQVVAINKPMQQQIRTK